jgi:hypothetical protein
MIELYDTAAHGSSMAGTCTRTGDSLRSATLLYTITHCGILISDPMILAALVYASVSSKDQEHEGFSIPAQLDLLRSYVAGRNVSIVKEFVDVETAKQAGRNSFGAVVAFIWKHRGRLPLLVEKTDRLYGNLRDWITLDELDLEMHLVKEGVMLSPESRSHEKFMHGIKFTWPRIARIGQHVQAALIPTTLNNAWR